MLVFLVNIPLLFNNLIYFISERFFFQKTVRLEALSWDREKWKKKSCDSRQNRESWQVWKSFRREWKFYELAAGIHKKAQEVRVASLLNVISKEGMDMCETFQWGDSSDATKTDRVLEKLDGRCVPVRNETYERYIFFQTLAIVKMNRLIIT